MTGLKTDDGKVEKVYEQAKATSAAQMYNLDDVIDPAESRDWITTGLRSLPPDFRPAGWMYRAEKKHWIDTW